MLGRNTHFSIAVHVCIALALHEGEALCSDVLAGSVETNPAFLRSVMSKLREAGIIESKRGAGGGSLLARDAKKITLLDLYQATGGEFELSTHAVKPDSKCFVNSGLCEVFQDVSQKLQTAMSKELKRVTIAALAERVAAHEKCESAE